MSHPNFSFDTNSPDIIEHDGRFYINGGRPGFNSRKNNGRGYDTEAEAREVLERHASEY